MLFSFLLLQLRIMLYLGFLGIIIFSNRSFFDTDTEVVKISYRTIGAR